MEPIADDKSEKAIVISRIKLLYDPSSNAGKLEGSLWEFFELVPLEHLLRIEERIIQNSKKEAKQQTPANHIFTFYLAEFNL